MHLRIIFILVIQFFILQGCAAYYRVISSIEDDDMETFAELIGREDVKVNYQVMTGETLLHNAVNYNRIEMVDSLLRRRANPFILNGEAESPFLIMLWDMRPEMISLIKKYRFDTEITDENGKNYYHLILDKYEKELDNGKEYFIKQKILSEEFKNELDTTLALRYSLKLDSLEERFRFSYKKLMELGVNINHLDLSKRTPLLYASMINELGLVFFLNSLIDDENSRIEFSNLKKGAFYALTPKTTQYISKGVTKNGISLANNDTKGNTPLLASAYYSKTLVQILTSLGCDPYMMDFSQEGLLHKSVRGGHLSMVEYCIEALQMDINKSNKSGNTPLHIAAEGSHLKKSTALIEKAAIFQKNSDMSGYLSKEDAYEKTLQFLLDKGAEVNSKNNEGQTPLMLALRNDKNRLAEILIKAGSDLSLKDNLEHDGEFYIKRGNSNLIELINKN